MRWSFQHRCVLLAFLLAVPSQPLVGQASVDLNLIGQRVRITAAEGGSPIVGVVAVRDSEVLRVVRAPDGMDSVQMDSIERLELSLGVHPRTLDGFWAGALVGGAVLGALGIVAAAELYEDRLDGFLMGAAYGAAVGGVAGALIGTAFRREYWREVALESAVDAGARLGVLPGPEGSITLGLTVSAP